MRVGGRLHMAHFPNNVTDLDGLNFLNDIYIRTKPALFYPFFIITKLSEETRPTIKMYE